MRTRLTLSMLALAAMISPLSANAQTAAPVHHASAHAAASALPKNIPPVHGIVHVAYALKYIDTKVGTGELATPNKFYTVHYTGWLASNGTKFDSSVDRGTPITFPQGAHRVIPGWDTGFEGMHIGGKRRLFIPYQLAYGVTGRPPVIPPKADLIFDIELISISDQPPAPAAPPQAPPATHTPPASPAPGSTPASPASPSTPAAPATPPAAGTTPPPSTPPQ